MKYFPLSLLLLTLSLFGCSASKPLTLSMNLSADKVYDFKSSTNTVANVKVMGMDQNTISDQYTEAKYKVIKASPEGEYTVNSIITAMSTSQQNAMSTTSFDSKNPDAGDPTTAKMMKPLIGFESTMVFNKKGDVISYEQDDLIGLMFQDADETMMQIKPSMEQQFSNEVMKQMFASFIGIFPDKPIKKGDTWNLKKEVKTTMQLLMDLTYTLNERKDGKAYISVVGTMSSDPTAPPMEMMGMKMTYDLSGPVNGKLVIDERTGWTVESNIQNVLKGKMKITMDAMGDMDADMEVTSETKTTITE